MTNKFSIPIPASQQAIREKAVLVFGNVAGEMGPGKRFGGGGYRRKSNGIQ
jgi:hypothetical protein